MYDMTAKAATKRQAEIDATTICYIARKTRTRWYVRQVRQFPEGISEIVVSAPVSAQRAAELVVSLNDGLKAHTMSTPANQQEEK